ncbi:uncharacterized protein LOC127530335 [Acanthochromis polyacanthus]|uniref:uncharacterized protein LOC127530335 n=1 Tax=Acanthochromis polyacanthus TaxID=80966 RepID=UPI002234AF14|nr:uncharacterized protein LOC127530335 [Acanthochromis polyacanthus]
MTDLQPQAKQKTSEDTSVLVDEILHSIFFLGNIQKPGMTPESILNDTDLFEALKSRYPRPFELYSCQLPRRSPFSCVLDMMVHVVGQEKEEEIRSRLQKFITDLEKDVPSKDLTRKEKKNLKNLISTVICISKKKSNNSVRYYGVSMSTSGCNAGQIMIAASCLGAWDDYVAGAVMTYYPNKSKKEYFDGTIHIPNYVRCQAFNLRKGGEMPPCRSCGNMFGLNTDETDESDYGNCAEAESLSNLLKIENKIKQDSRPKSIKCTADNRERAKRDADRALKNVLSRIEFNTWNGTFYTPESKKTA